MSEDERKKREKREADERHEREVAERRRQNDETVAIWTNATTAANS